MGDMKCMDEMKLKGLKEKLKIWNRDNFLWLTKKIQKDIVENMSNLDKRDMEVGRVFRILLWKKELWESLWIIVVHIESLNRQKSRVGWIMDGDCNTKYFHLMVKWRGRKKSIKGLPLEGWWVKDPWRIKDEVKKFFSKEISRRGERSISLDGMPFERITNEESGRWKWCLKKRKLKK